MKLTSTLTTLVLAACAILAFPAAKASAPADSTGCGTRFVDTRRPTKMVELGLHIGEGAASMVQNYGTAVPHVGDFTLTPGSLTQFGASAVIPVRNFFAIGTGLNFNINNYYYSMTILHPGAGTLNTLYTRNRFYNFDVPLFLAFRFNLGTHVRWDNELGAYLSFGCGGHSHTRAYTSSTNDLGQSQVAETNYRVKYYNPDQALINGVTSVDWGLHLGTGILVNGHVSVKCVMHAGARDLAKNYGVLNVQNHTLNVVFSAGYVF